MPASKSNLRDNKGHNCSEECKKGIPKNRYAGMYSQDKPLPSCAETCKLYLRNYVPNIGLERPTRISRPGVQDTYRPSTIPVRTTTNKTPEIRGNTQGKDRVSLLKKPSDDKKNVEDNRLIENCSVQKPCHPVILVTNQKKIPEKAFKELAEVQKRKIGNKELEGQLDCQKDTYCPTIKSLLTKDIVANAKILPPENNQGNWYLGTSENKENETNQYNMNCHAEKPCPTLKSILDEIGTRLSGVVPAENDAATTRMKRSNAEMPEMPAERDDSEQVEKSCIPCLDKDIKCQQEVPTKTSSIRTNKSADSNSGSAVPQTDVQGYKEDAIDMKKTCSRCLENQTECKQSIQSVQSKQSQRSDPEKEVTPLKSSQEMKKTCSPCLENEIECEEEIESKQSRTVTLKSNSSQMKKPCSPCIENEVECKEEVPLKSDSIQIKKSCSPCVENEIECKEEVPLKSDSSQMKKKCSPCVKNELECLEEVPLKSDSIQIAENEIEGKEEVPLKSRSSQMKKKCSPCIKNELECIEEVPLTSDSIQIAESEIECKEEVLLKSGSSQMKKKCSPCVKNELECVEEVPLKSDSIQIKKSCSPCVEKEIECKEEVPLKSDSSQMKKVPMESESTDIKKTCSPCSENQVECKGSAEAENLDRTETVTEGNEEEPPLKSDSVQIKKSCTPCLENQIECKERAEKESPKEDLEHKPVTKSDSTQINTPCTVCFQKPNKMDSTQTEKDEEKIIETVVKDPQEKASPKKCKPCSGSSQTDKSCRPCFVKYETMDKHTDTMEEEKAPGPEKGSKESRKEKQPPKSGSTRGSKSQKSDTKEQQAKKKSPSNLLKRLCGGMPCNKKPPESTDKVEKEDKAEVKKPCRACLNSVEAKKSCEPCLAGRKGQSDKPIVIEEPQVEQVVSEADSVEARTVCKPCAGSTHIKNLCTPCFAKPVGSSKEKVSSEPAPEVEPVAVTESVAKEPESKKDCKPCSESTQIGDLCTPCFDKPPEPSKDNVPSKTASEVEPEPAAVTESVVKESESKKECPPCSTSTQIDDLCTPCFEDPVEPSKEKIPSKTASEVEPEALAIAESVVKESESKKECQPCSASTQIGDLCTPCFDNPPEPSKEEIPSKTASEVEPEPAAVTESVVQASESKKECQPCSESVQIGDLCTPCFENAPDPSKETIRSKTTSEAEPEPAAVTESVVKVSKSKKECPPCSESTQIRDFCAPCFEKTPEPSKENVPSKTASEVEPEPAAATESVVKEPESKIECPPCSESTQIGDLCTPCFEKPSEPSKDNVPSKNASEIEPVTTAESVVKESESKKECQPCADSNNIDESCTPCIEQLAVSKEKIPSIPALEVEPVAIAESIVKESGSKKECKPCAGPTQIDTLCAPCFEKPEASKRIDEQMDAKEEPVETSGLGNEQELSEVEILNIPEAKSERCMPCSDKLIKKEMFPEPCPPCLEKQQTTTAMENKTSSVIPGNEDTDEIAELSTSELEQVTGKPSSKIKISDLSEMSSSTSFDENEEGNVIPRWKKKCGEGIYQLNPLLEVCERNPDSVLVTFKTTPGSDKKVPSESVEIIDETKEPYMEKIFGTTYGDPEYHLLMVDNTTSVTKKDFEEKEIVKADNKPQIVEDTVDTSIKTPVEPVKPMRFGDFEVPMKASSDKYEHPMPRLLEVMTPGRDEIQPVRPSGDDYISLHKEESPSSGTDEEEKRKTQTKRRSTVSWRSAKPVKSDSVSAASLDQVVKEATVKAENFRHNLDIRKQHSLLDMVKRKSTVEKLVEPPKPVHPPRKRKRFFNFRVCQRKKPAPAQEDGKEAASDSEAEKDLETESDETVDDYAKRPNQGSLFKTAPRRGTSFLDNPVFEKKKELNQFLNNI